MIPPIDKNLAAAPVGQDPIRENALYRQYSVALQTILPVLARINDPLAVRLGLWAQRFLEELRPPNPHPIIAAHMEELRRILQEPDLAEAHPFLNQFFAWAQRHLHFQIAPVREPAPINDDMAERIQRIRERALRAQAPQGPALEARGIIEEHRQQRAQIFQRNVAQFQQNAENIAHHNEEIRARVENILGVIEADLEQGEGAAEGLEEENQEIAVRLQNADQAMTDIEREQLQKRAEINACRAAIISANKSGGGFGEILGAIVLVAVCLAINYASGGTGSGAVLSPTPNGGAMAKFRLLTFK